MIKKHILIIALVVSALSVEAQTDPIDWILNPRQTKKIARGVTWIQIAFTKRKLFGQR